MPLRAAETFLSLRRLKSELSRPFLALSAVVRTGLASAAFLRGMYQCSTNQLSVALLGPAAAIT